jgi:hypothetical protein
LFRIRLLRITLSEAKTATPALLFSIPVSVSAAIPMRFDSTIVPSARSSTPLMFPEMVLPVISVAELPVPTRTPLSWFPRSAVPVGSVPIRLPVTSFPVAPEPEMTTPLVPFPEIVFPGPTTFDGVETETPAPLLGRGPPAVSRPILFPVIVVPVALPLSWIPFPTFPAIVLPSIDVPSASLTLMPLTPFATAPVPALSRPIQLPRIAFPVEPARNTPMPAAPLPAMRLRSPSPPTTVLSAPSQIRIP